MHLHKLSLATRVSTSPALARAHATATAPSWPWKRSRQEEREHWKASILQSCQWRSIGWCTPTWLWSTRAGRLRQWFQGSITDAAPQPREDTATAVASTETSHSTSANGTPNTELR